MKKIEELALEIIEICQKEERVEVPIDERLEHAYEKIKRLEEENRNLRKNSLFTLEDDAAKNAWEEHQNSGCKSRNTYYKVLTTGIGDVALFVCDRCGFEKEIGNTIM